MQLKTRLDSVTDRERWAARAVSFTAKLKATRAVWFPPDPAEEGKAKTAAAKKTTKRTARRTTGAAKRSTRATKKAPAKKTARSAK